MLQQAELIHISGDRGGAAFGFDPLAWLPEEDRVLVVEVKTGRSLKDVFHFSRRQNVVAAMEGERIGLLRVTRRDCDAWAGALAYSDESGHPFRGIRAAVGAKRRWDVVAVVMGGWPEGDLPRTLSDHHGVWADTDLDDS